MGDTSFPCASALFPSFSIGVFFGAGGFLSSMRLTQLEIFLASDQGQLSNLSKEHKYAANGHTMVTVILETSAIYASQMKYLQEFHRV